MKREKKSESLEVRLGHAQKRAFMEVCRQRGSTASDVLRSFIDGVIDDAERAAMKEKAPSRLKELSMMMKQNPRKILTGGVSALGAFALFAATPSVADDSVFDRLDTDGDGYLVAEELGEPGTSQFGSAMNIVESLDQNRDGKLSPSEFSSPVNVVVMVGEERTNIDGDEQRLLKLSVIAYDFTDKETTCTSIWSTSTSVPLDATDEEVDEITEEFYRGVDNSESRSSVGCPALKEKLDEMGPLAGLEKKPGAKIIEKTEEVRKSRPE